MIIPGLKYWSNITGDKESGVPEMNMEVVGQQFNWTFRYPGEDKALGPVEFDQIGADNTLGLDTTSAKTQDDFTTKEMHVPVNTRINVQIRSLDVLHGFYLPHFRANMYATPGMPTNFSFTPTMTTQEARKKYNDKDFDFELACTQLCGGSHYQMRSIVVVHSQEGYREWYQKQLKENSGGDSDGDGKSQDQKEKGKESMPKQAQKQASDEAAQQPNA
jgi:cytochrome c oxidase subunit 2